MTILLEKLQCLTNAPEEYDYGWMKTLVRNIAVDQRGKSWRLCQNADQWHLEQQIMRYGSGMYQAFTQQSQAQVNEWLQHGLLTLTDNPIPIIRLEVPIIPLEVPYQTHLKDSIERRGKILKVVRMSIPDVTATRQELRYVFTCEGEKAAHSCRQALKHAQLKFGPYTLFD